MKLDKRHLIVSFVLLVGSIVYNLWVFTSPPGRTAERSGVAALGAPSPVPQVSGSMPEVFDPSQVPTLPEIALDRLPEWPRDPFANPRAVRPVVVEVEAETLTPAPPDVDPVVASILYSTTRRLAVVDGRIVRIGDAVGTATVVDILPKAVIVESPARGRRTIELRLPQTAVDPR
jgi:hypothetical protein